MKNYLKKPFSKRSTNINASHKINVDEDVANFHQDGEVFARHSVLDRSKKQRRGALGLNRENHHAADGSKVPNNSESYESEKFHRPTEIQFDSDDDVDIISDRSYQNLSQIHEEQYSSRVPIPKSPMLCPGTPRLSQNPSVSSTNNSAIKSKRFNLAHRSSKLFSNLSLKSKKVNSKQNSKENINISPTRRMASHCCLAPQANNEPNIDLQVRVPIVLEENSQPAVMDLFDEMDESNFMEIENSTNTLHNLPIDGSFDFSDIVDPTLHTSDTKIQVFNYTENAEKNEYCPKNRLSKNKSYRIAAQDEQFEDYTSAGRPRSSLSNKMRSATRSTSCRKKSVSNASDMSDIPRTARKKSNSGSEHENKNERDSRKVSTSRLSLPIRVSYGQNLNLSQNQSNRPHSERINFKSTPLQDNVSEEVDNVSSIVTREEMMSSEESRSSRVCQYDGPVNKNLLLSATSMSSFQSDVRKTMPNPAKEKRNLLSPMPLEGRNALSCRENGSIHSKSNLHTPSIKNPEPLTPKNKSFLFPSPFAFSRHKSSIGGLFGSQNVKNHHNIIANSKQDNNYDSSNRSATLNKLFSSNLDLSPTKMARRSKRLSVELSGMLREIGIMKYKCFVI